MRRHLGQPLSQGRENIHIPPGTFGGLTAVTTHVLNGGNDLDVSDVGCIPCRLTPNTLCMHTLTLVFQLQSCREQLQVISGLSDTRQIATAV